MELLIVVYSVLFAVYLLCMYAIREGKLTAWKATALMIVISIGGGLIYSYMTGAGFVGAICMVPLLLVPAAMFTLGWGKALEKKNQRSNQDNLNSQNNNHSD